MIPGTILGTTLGTILRTDGIPRGTIRLGTILTVMVGAATTVGVVIMEAIIPIVPDILAVRQA